MYLVACILRLTSFLLRVVMRRLSQSKYFSLFFSTPRASLQAPLNTPWTLQHSPRAFVQRTVSSTGSGTHQRKHPTFREELQNLYTWFRRPATNGHDESGMETIVFHVPDLHWLWKISQFFPFVVLATSIGLSDTLWNHNRIKNPSHDPLNPVPDEPAFIPRPREQRISSVVATASVAALVIVAVARIRRRIVQTIAFRTNQPRHKPTGTNSQSRPSKSIQGENVVVVTSINGQRITAPVQACELLDTKTTDRLTLKLAGHPGHYLIEVEEAEIGWPEVTTTIKPFAPSRESNQSVKQQRDAHNLKAKLLFGQIWRIHSTFTAR